MEVSFLKSQTVNVRCQNRACLALPSAENPITIKMLLWTGWVCQTCDLVHMGALIEKGIDMGAMEEAKAKAAEEALIEDGRVPVVIEPEETAPVPVTAGQQEAADAAARAAKAAAMEEKPITETPVAEKPKAKKAPAKKRATAKKKATTKKQPPGIRSRA